MADPAWECELAMVQYYSIRLKSREHPEALWTRIRTAFEKLHKMNATIDPHSLDRRYVKAIQDSPEGRHYYTPIQGHLLEERQGKKPKMEDLRVALTYKYEEMQSTIREKQRGIPRTSPPGRPVAAPVVQGTSGSKPAKRGQNHKAHQRKKVCKNCGKRGHHPSECPEPQRCYRCRKEGHLAATCPTRASSNNTDIAATLIAATKARGAQTQDIYIDSACPVHIINNPEHLINTTTVNTPLSFSSVTNSNLILDQVGIARITTDQGTLRLDEAYLAPQSPVNILSLVQLANKGWRINLNKSKGGRYIAKGGNKFDIEFTNGYWTLKHKKFVNKLYDSPYSQPVLATRSMHTGSTTNDPIIWHKRLGHPSSRQMNTLIQQGLAPKAAQYSHTQFHTCLTTQSRARPIPNTPEPSGEHAVQADYVPIEKKDKMGWKQEVGVYVYAVRKSRLTAVYPVRGASSREAAQVLQKFITHAKTIWNIELTLVQTDQGTQFLSIEWVRMCHKLGVKQRQCPTNAQAMNGQVERVQGILVGKMRALMHDTETPTRFWPMAIQHASWIYNRTPNRALQGKTPWEVATGTKPDLNVTRVFGCKAYAQIPKDERRSKTQNPTWEGILVGYSETSPEWIILDPKSLRLRNLFHVKFNGMETHG